MNISSSIQVKKAVFCSFALVLLYPLGIDLYLVGLPQIALSLNASEAQLHHAFSLYLLGMVISMSVGGVASDKLGRKPIALIGVGIFSLASYLAMTATKVEWFLLARLLQGVGAGLPYVVTFAILRDILDDNKRAKVLSVVNGIICILPILAPVLGHFILQRFAWSTLFSTMLLAALIIGVIAGLLLWETLGCKGQGLKSSESSTGVESSETKGSDGYHELLSSFFISRLVISALNVGMILTFVNVSPFLLMEQLGLSTGEYSAVMSSTALVSMLAAFLTPKLLERFDQNSVVVIAQALLLFSAVALIFAGVFQAGLELYFIGFCLLCASFSLGFGAITSQALSPFSRHAGLASSMLGCCQIAFSAVYIGACAWLGMNPLTMLLFLLLLAGGLGIVLVKKIDSTANPIATQVAISES